MSGSPEEWDYLCPDDRCSNRVNAIPVPNVVHCGICGEEMIVYTTEEGK